MKDSSAAQVWLKPLITAEDLLQLRVLDPTHSFDGDGRLLRLGHQAYALGIAYEFDPYFGLSISRVDPLPHQLEAIYDCLLKLARVRFLLAQDAGAGKTIMSGLLIRELGLRWLAERILNGHRDATMILIAYRHGLRASELCGLRWDQIDLNSGRLHVQERKAGSITSIP